MYPSDLSDEQWELIKPFIVKSLPEPGSRGRPPKQDFRAEVNAMLYVLKTGSQWRSLPKDFPHWSTVNGYMNRWRAQGIWDAILNKLREQVRRKAGRNAQPSVAIVDSRSVKTASKGGQRGYDAGKKVKGRKQHIAVDTQGWLLAVVVHSAGIQDRVGARALLIRLFCIMHTLKTIYVDGGYTGKLLDWAKQMFGWRVEVVKRNEQHQFKVLPKRWIVERSFAWAG